MSKVDRAKLLIFLAAMALIVVTYACGVSAPAPSGAPVPSAETNQPSGSGGNAPVATHTSLTALPFLIEPTPTAESPGEPAPVAPLPAIPESRRLTLEYPPKIRTGDSDVIRLTLEVDTLGNLTPTAEIQGNLVTGGVVQIPNLYDTHNIIAEARIDLAGVEVRPSETIGEPLLQGQSVTFYWSVRPLAAGTFRGTAWLFLRFVDKVSKVESSKAISAQPVQITATNLLGLTGTIARTAGSLGSLVGAVLGFPFVDDVLKWLWSRITKRV
jgi:hypothetical protein